MTLKTKNISFIAGLTALFLALWGASTFAEAPEGFSGFGEFTDLSPNDQTLIFSYYHDDDASLYTVPVNGGKAVLLAEPAEGKSYVNPVYSPDGDKVVFLEQWEEENAEEKNRRYSQLRIADMSDNSVEALLNTEHFIIDAAFSPDGDSLYFLKAASYQNYSPIASEKPHDLDIFRLNMKSGNIEQITYQKAYDMSSLNVSSDGEQLMYSVFGNGGGDELKLRSLESGRTRTIVPEGDFKSKDPIISTPALSPDGEHAVFSDVAAKDENGTFIYEAFKLNLETGQAEQMTSFNEHVTNPVFFHEQNKVIVTLDENFPSSEPDYSYWMVHANNDERERISIEMPDN